MFNIVKFAEAKYRQIKAYLRRQAQTGDYWQPRCYRGDPNWWPQRNRK